MPPRDLEEFEVLKEQFLPPGLTNAEFQRAYYQSFHKLLGRDRAKNKLELLVNAGLLEEQADPNDKRKTRYVCEGVGYEKEEPKTDMEKRLKQTLDFIKVHCKNDGQIRQEIVLDQDALKQLLKEGAVYIPLDGFVKATEEGY